MPVFTSANVSTTPGPAVAWHTLSAFKSSDVLLFGGLPGVNSPPPLVGLADSAWLLDVYNRLVPQWSSEVTSWADEPIRRIHHSSATTKDGRVIIIGGEKADGSGIVFSDHYIFDPDSPSFTLLPSENGPPDITGHVSIMLANGYLVVFGGYCGSESTMLSFSTIWVMDTTQSILRWFSLTVVSGTLPNPRRAFAAVLLEGGKILIHGGSDVSFQTTYADAWILDTSQSPPVWTEVDLSQIGARRDHFAISYGSFVIFGLGQ